MTTLHDRLDDLAADAPTAPSAYAGDLWARGKRFQRRRRAVSAVIVAATVLAVATLGLGSVRQGAQPGYVGSPEAPAALPSRLHEPSPWLPGTDDEGPLGQLAVVLFADRGSWTGSEYAPVGVSATTGEYRYLDLPDRAPAVEVALSRDGRRLAYWTTGETSGSPNSNSGPVTGIAVYDTGTGAVVRHEIDTEHGLSPDQLLWIDDDRVLAGFGQYRGGDGDDEMDQASAGPAPLLVWDMEQDPMSVPGVRAWDVLGVVADGTVLASAARSGYRIVDLDDPGQARRLTVKGRLSGGPLVRPDGRRLVAVSGSANPNRMVVGDVGAGPEVRLRPVPRSAETFAAFAWVDDDRVAVIRRVHDEVDGWDTELVLVDVTSGASELLMTQVLALGQVRDQVIALDLLGRASVDRPAPPRPRDPRAVAGSSVALVLAGVVALVLWRRRVRA